MQRSFTSWLPIYFTLTLPLGCGSNDPATPPAPKALPLLISYPLAISEPSGLAIDESGTSLWTVTNNPARVYLLDTSGTVLDTLAYHGKDLEGIEYDLTDHTLWLVEENSRQVVHLDAGGHVLSKHPLALQGELNSGLEGITIDSDGRMCVLNEKHPALFLRLNPDFSIAEQLYIRFAADVSGLAAGPQPDTFWIVSDQEQRLYLWSRQAGVLDQYSLSYPKAEGVAVDATNERMYIVSDSENTLYVYPLQSVGAPTFRDR